MKDFDAKCMALLIEGRDQDGKFAEKKDCELSFYRRGYFCYKKYLNTIYSQAILDQQQIISELKEVKGNLILERKHNERLKNEIEILKKK